MSNSNSNCLKVQAPRAFNNSPNFLLPFPPFSCLYLNFFLASFFSLPFIFLFSSLPSVFSSYPSFFSTLPFLLFPFPSLPFPLEFLPWPKICYKTSLGEGGGAVGNIEKYAPLDWTWFYTLKTIGRDLRLTYIKERPSIYSRGRKILTLALKAKEPQGRGPRMKPRKNFVSFTGEGGGLWSKSMSVWHICMLVCM